MFEVRRGRVHLSASSCFPLLDELTLILGLLLSILDRNVLTLVRLENRTDVRRFVDTNGCQFPVSLEMEGGQGASHSRKGISSTSPLSPGSPFHGFTTMAFSGLATTCSGCVSS
jgi:hypothetical protein